MWENIRESRTGKFDKGENYNSSRLKVPGGWVVRSVVTRYGGGASCSQVFVADPEHK